MSVEDDRDQLSSFPWSHPSLRGHQVVSRRISALAASKDADDQALATVLRKAQSAPLGPHDLLLLLAELPSGRGPGAPKGSRSKEAEDRDWWEIFVAAKGRKPTWGDFERVGGRTFAARMNDRRKKWFGSDN